MTRKMQYCGNCGSQLAAKRTGQPGSKPWVSRLLDYLAACGRDRKKLYNLMLAIVLVPTMLYVAFIIIMALLGL